MVVVDEINAGDIGALVGIRGLRSGDTFVDEFDMEEINLKGMKLPPPVFFCSIDSESHADTNKLTEVLELMSLEDPTIQVSHNDQTG